MLLNSQSLSKSFGMRMLFKDISIALLEGERTGLIGPNGTGKSTLLKILAGLEPSDSGQITTRRNLRIGYLAQEDIFPPGATPESVLYAALEDQHLDEHDRLTQVSIMLSKMEFAKADQLAENLSGGWRKRLAIARQLIQKPDLLLLDEPTNHLDLEGINWLEKLLKNAPFAFMMISHDRYFLENVCNRVVELNRSYPEGYFSVNGPYSEFLTRREEFLSGQASQQQALAGKVRREIEWLHRGAKARTTKAKGRIEEAGRLIEELAEVKIRNSQNRAIQIDFNATERKTRKLLSAKGVTKSLGGNTLFSHLNLILSPGTKLGLLGPNGSGKTTLIRLLTDQLQPDEGEIVRADGLRVVLFDQNRKQLDKEMTLRTALSPQGDSVVYRGNAIHVSGWARQFLFRTEQLDLPVGELSGGEQARILVAQLMLQPADVLILDEPTNDLDIPSLEVLEDSLEDFPGAVVLVTHDRYMLDRLCTEILGLDGQGKAHIYAELSQWEQSQLAAREAAARKAAPPKSAPTPQKTAAPSKRLSWKEQKEWEQIEAKVMAAESEVEACHKAMEDPAILADHIRLNEYCAKMHDAQEQVKALYARWEELEAKQR